MVGPLKNLVRKRRRTGEPSESVAAAPAADAPAEAALRFQLAP